MVLTKNCTLIGDVEKNLFWLLVQSSDGLNITKLPVNVFSERTSNSFLGFLEGKFFQQVTKRHFTILRRVWMCSFVSLFSSGFFLSGFLKNFLDSTYLLVENQTYS